MQALYRKYRPKTFEEVVGQKITVNILKRQVQNGETVHAYLFSGTRGTGKTSCAKIFARAVNCENPQNGNPCNECDTCKGILQEKILDVIEMDAASNNSVDDIREIKENAAYPPSYGKKKVYIIDEVHMLSKGAFNALLKILEEPPEHMIFILATTEFQKIPSTIVSRTQRFQFERIKVSEIIGNLENILKKENISYEPQALMRIAENSEGSMRDSLSLLDQVLTISDEKLTEEMTLQSMGVVSEEEILALFQSILDKDMDGMIEIFQREYEKGKNLQRFLESLLNFCRNLLFYKEVGKSPVELSRRFEVEIQKQGDQFSREEVLDFIEIFSTAILDIRYAQLPKLYCEICLMKVYERKNLTKVQYSVEENPKSEEGFIIHEENSTKEKNKDNEAPSSLKEEMAHDIIDNQEEWTRQWEAIQAKIGAISKPTEAFLKDGKLLKVSSHVVTIGFPEKFSIHLEKMKDSRHKEVIQRVFQEMDATITDVEIVPIVENDTILKTLQEKFGEEKIEIIED